MRGLQEAISAEKEKNTKMKKQLKHVHSKSKKTIAVLEKEISK